MMRRIWNADAAPGCRGGQALECKPGRTFAPKARSLWCGLIALALLPGCDLFFRDDVPAGACPDLTGRWTSAVFNPLKVFANGNRETQADTSTVLEVLFQDGCQFHATNTWSSGTRGGTEQVVGVVSGESGEITMIEVGPHPETGSSALIQARLDSAGRMTWEYVGLADDDAMGKAFNTRLVKR